MKHVEELKKIVKNFDYLISSVAKKANSQNITAQTLHSIAKEALPILIK